MKPEIKKIAVVGGGVAGLTAAFLLCKKYEITLFEKNNYVGGHTNTISIPSGLDQGVAVDTGFIVYNDKNYPTFIRLLNRLGVQGIPSDMSFGFSNGSVEYSSYFPWGLFAQKRNLLRPSFIGMICDIARFNKLAIKDLAEGRLRDLDLGAYLETVKMGQAFKNHYLYPMTAAIWSMSPHEMKSFPAEMFARFFLNHGLLSFGKRPQWKVIQGGSQTYVRKMLEALKGQYRVSCAVKSVKRVSNSVEILTQTGDNHFFDAVIFAAHADESLSMLVDPSADEKRLLGAWSYTSNHVVLHTDESAMPKRQKAWASWNYFCDNDSRGNGRVTLTYHMNRLQSLTTQKQYFVTLNTERAIAPEKIIREIYYTHPRYTLQSLATQSELPQLNGVNRTYFCGSYFRYGFHEDAVQSAVNVAESLGATL